MMRQRMFPWMGLCVLFVFTALGGTAIANGTYAVKRGDTLTRIAAKTGMTVKALKAANASAGSLLRVNQILIIPSNKIDKTAKSTLSSIPQGKKYVIKKGDSLFGIARRAGVSVRELRKLNRMRGNKLKVGQELVLTEKPNDEIAAPAPLEYANREIRPQIEDEEEEDVDNLFTPEEAWAEIERRKQERTALLGNWNHPDEQKLLVKVALGFLGAPYRLGGYSVNGIDCSGFVKKIYQIFNVELPRTAFDQSHLGMRVARDELAEGDLIFFNTRRPVGHVGIYIGNNQFVHAASRKKGVRVDNLNTPYYKKRFFRAVRLKGTHDGL